MHYSAEVFCRFFFFFRFPVDRLLWIHVLRLVKFTVYDIKSETLASLPAVATRRFLTMVSATKF